MRTRGWHLLQRGLPNTTSRIQNNLLGACINKLLITVCYRAFDHGGHGLHMPDDHLAGRLAVSDGIFDRVFCLGGGKSQRQHR